MAEFSRDIRREFFHVEFKLLSSSRVAIETRMGPATENSRTLKPPARASYLPLFPAAFADKAPLT
jgi:hypothetical protein